MRKSYKATGALLLSVAGFAGTYPYSGSFFAGLLNSGCLAAMIGGLADWFAVTALFHKPLGIAYRTEILVRNRERLLQALVEFAGSDLLSVANIMKIVRREDLVQMILQYLDKYEGREKLKQAVNQFVDAVLAEMDTKRIGRELAESVKTSLGKIDLPEIGLQVLEESLQAKYSDRAMEFIVDHAGQLILDPALQAILQKNVAAIKADYEKGSTSRKLMLDMFDLSEERLAEIVTGQLLGYVEGLKDPKHAVRQRLERWLADQVASLAKSPDYRLAVMAWEKDLVENKLPIAGRIADYLEKCVQGSRQDLLSAERGINAFIDARIDQLGTDEVLQQELDRRLKAGMESFIRSKHGFVLQVIRERLTAFSDAALVEFVEARIADDLQMIRINGSLIGALVGMLLYAVTFMAERMWR